jgi:hypothetical protein
MGYGAYKRSVERTEWRQALQKERELRLEDERRGIKPPRKAVLGPLLALLIIGVVMVVLFGTLGHPGPHF